ncbi:hypothetical protein HYZ97_03795 [Candidatus Pacearchaeota archaeon]|nr:hypothetical protein [Candidatus Pacearchaeota archaeon]
MGVIEDIKKMRSEGRSDQEIVQALQVQGLSPKQIYEGISQTAIKEAVSENPNVEPSIRGRPGTMATQELELQPSLASAPEQQEYGQPLQESQEQGYTQYSAQQPQEGYSSYGLSADMVSEVAEQVVNERLAGLRNELEKVIALRTSFESRTDILDERLKRIEKIIDRLQLSILQKVGDYMTNVEDIKKELIETQKSFKSLKTERERKDASE